MAVTIQPVTPSIIIMQVIPGPGINVPNKPLLWSGRANKFLALLGWWVMVIYRASFCALYYIYILYSFSTNLHYVRYSNNLLRRLDNTKPYNTFTLKHRPWILKASFAWCKIEGEAIKVEKFSLHQIYLPNILCSWSFGNFSHG